MRQELENIMSSSDLILISKKIDILLDKIKPDKRQDVEKAIIFSAKHHQGQRRKSGEPFVAHPIEVATILAEEEMDKETIIAALCHDLIEDSPVARDDIENQFGERVAFLVEGVTKITSVARAGEEGRRSSLNFQKFIVAVSKDPRVLIIKLADRVHNLRTIRALSNKRQKAIAEETLKGYAPLAHRIGMKKIQSELEDRSLEIIDPEAYMKAGLVIEDAKKTGKKYLDQIVQDIQKSLDDFQIKAEVKARIKSRFSVAEKMRRYKDEARPIEDVLGVRIITDTTANCYLALGAVHLLFPPKEESFDDYIAKPRSNLYQSLHTSVLVPFEGKRQIIEVQIRTKKMDEVAEHGLAAHWQYKTSLRDDSVTEALNEISNKATDDIDQVFSDLKKDLLSSEIYCFTPAGDVRILPQGSTAIDFAYAIHSDLGDQIVGARVDGKLYPITKPLLNESVVEVTTSKRNMPAKDWLYIVKTQKAKQRIKAASEDEIDREEKSYLNQLREELKEEGHLQKASLPTRDLIFMIIDLRPGMKKETVLDNLKSKRFREEVIKSIPKKVDSKPRKRVRKLERPEVLIDNKPGIEYTAARCCNPEPGDDIIGYVSHTRGVVIHKFNCRNVANLAKDSSRMIKAEYQKGEGSVFETKIKVKLKDRPGLLADIADAVYRSGSEIININLNSRYGIVSGEILCRVSSSSEELKKEIAAIEGFLKLDN